MPTIKEFTNTKQTVTVLYNIRTCYSLELIQLFLNEDGKVIVIDEVNSTNKKLISSFLTNPNFMFLDIKSITKHIDSFMRIDYIYLLMDSIIAGSDYPNLLKTKFNYVALTHKDFTEQSNYVDIFIKLAIEYASKITITLPYYLDTLIAPINKYNLKLFESIRDLFFDHFNRVAFNGRLIYLPETIGKKYDYSLSSLQNYLIRQTIKNKTIKIPGDGLIKLNLIDQQDLVKALLLASFSAKTTGKEVLIEPTTITILNFLYSVLELTKNEKKLEFTEMPQEIIENQKQVSKIIPKQFITTADLGYKNQQPINESIIHLLSTTNQLLQGDWQPAKQEEIKTITVQTKPKTKELLPNFGEKYKKFDNPVEKYFWLALWKLFNIFIKTPVDFIYKILTEDSSNINKQLIHALVLIVTSFTIALFLTPYIVLSTNLSKLKPQEPQHFLQQLYTIEKNLYNISYLSKTKLNNQLTYLQEILKDYEELLEKTQQANEVYNGYLTFLKNLFTDKDNKDYLKTALSNPYFIDNVANQLYLLAQKVENLHPIYNTIFENQLLKSKPVLLQQAQITQEQIQNLRTIYPYMPQLFGLNTEQNYALLIVDNTKPNLIGGYPIGIFKITIKDGNIIKTKYIPFNNSQQVYNTINLEKLINNIKSLTLKSGTIAIINTDYIINLFNQIKQIYIPEQGTITSNQVQNIINNFTNKVKLPFSQQEFFITLFNQISKLESQNLQQAINLLFRPNNNNWMILATNEQLIDFFDALHNFIYNPTTGQRSDTLKLAVFDKTNIFDTSYKYIKPIVHMIIYPEQHKITINYEYQGNKVFSGTKNFIVSGKILNLKTNYDTTINLPLIQQPVNYKPNTQTTNFIQFNYSSNINKIFIYNPFNRQELYIHVINPSQEVMQTLEKYGTKTQQIDDTYIFKIKAPFIKIVLNS